MVSLIITYLGVSQVQVSVIPCARASAHWDRGTYGRTVYVYVDRKVEVFVYPDYAVLVFKLLLVNSEIWKSTFVTVYHSCGMATS